MNEWDGSDGLEILADFCRACRLTSPRVSERVSGVEWGRGGGGTGALEILARGRSILRKLGRGGYSAVLFTFY